MNNLNWEFFEVYKSLDELCKQILSCEGSGVSHYIDEMSKDKQGKMLVKGWEQDYKQLKRMRWIRNQLAHESNSFEDKNYNMENESEDWMKGIFYALLIGFLIGTGIVVLIGIYFRI